MKPVSPTIPGHDLPETIIAKDQEEYDDLPAYRYDDKEGTVLVRWKLSWRERLHVLWTGDIYMFMNTFWKAVQPVMLQTERPIADPRRSIHPPEKTE